jgi:hypothetical protein
MRRKGPQPGERLQPGEAGRVAAGEVPEDFKDAEPARQEVTDRYFDNTDLDSILGERPKRAARGRTKAAHEDFNAGRPPARRARLRV